MFIGKYWARWRRRGSRGRLRLRRGFRRSFVNLPEDLFYDDLRGFCARREGVGKPAASVVEVEHARPLWPAGPCWLDPHAVRQVFTGLNASVVRVLRCDQLGTCCGDD